MRRYMIYIEADIPILDDDLLEEDYMGLDKDDHTGAACNSVQRIVGHTGIQVLESFCSVVDDV